MATAYNPFPACSRADELLALRQARLDLLRGKQKVSARYQDKSVTYTPADGPALDREIAEIESFCRNEAAGCPAGPRQTHGCVRPG